MKHYMKLDSRYFDLISRGIKTFELRLNDDKRRTVKVGDTVIFTDTADDNAHIEVKVIGLHRFDSFAELYKVLPLDKCGYLPEQICEATPGDMEKYYSVDKQKKYGVLGIEIELQ